jgi:hypothetical protein
VPLVVLAAIAVAWLAALSAQATGAASVLHHDALIEDGPGSGLPCPRSWSRGR